MIRLFVRAACTNGAQLDPGFAPAWAHLGRCHRVISKFIDGAPAGTVRAESALRQAVELDPQLAVAHKYLAHLEADSGHSKRALARLLEQVSRHGNDAELFAGLVHACRYCGLADASFAAHAEARRLDPNVPTSVEDTLLIAGDIERPLAPSMLPTGAEHANKVIGLGLAGRRDEARGRQRGSIAARKTWCSILLLMVHLRCTRIPRPSSRKAGCCATPETTNEGLARLGQAVTKGYFAAQTLSSSRQFDLIRQTAAFQAILASASSGREEALRIFRDAGGHVVLGTWEMAA